MNLAPLFSPRSIAVIGASADRTKLGNVIFRNCRQFGYAGSVVPINPHAENIEGVRAYATIAEVPSRPDLSIIATPAPTIPALVAQLARARVPAVCIISAGFRETGKQGERREYEVIRIAAGARMALLGPNCLGFVAPHLKLNASFAHGLPEEGSVSIVSQSGAMAVAIADWASTSLLGFRYLISLGNKAVLNEKDVLDALARDPGTRVVLMYLEDVREGSDFLKLVASIARRLPIVVLIAGKTQAAAAAVASHTGSLASSGQTTVAALRSAGCIVVDTIEEWFDCARAFSHARVPRGKRIGIVTNAGGPGILATDAVGKYDLEMAHLSSSTISKLRASLPQTAASHNPIDVVGDAPPTRYRAALATCIRDPHVDALIAVLTHQLVTDSLSIAQEIQAIQRTSTKPIYASFVGGSDIRPAVDWLSRQGIPVFAYPESAARSLAHVLDWQLMKSFDVPRQLAPHRPFRFVRGFLLGQQALAQLKRYGITGAPGATVRSVELAVHSSAQLGYPVVMKVISSTTLHKTDVRGVVMDVHSEGAAYSTAQDFVRRFGRSFRLPGEGILIQPHIQEAVEVFVGATQVPQFGPMVLVGLGGIFVESLHAVEYAPAPLDDTSAKKLLMRSALWPVISGTRGKKYAVSALIKTVVGISQLIAHHPEVASIDCNPVMLTERHALVVDARILQSP